jgi:hypothetical protein
MGNNLEAFVALAVFLVEVMSGVFLLLALYQEGPLSGLSCWVRALARPWDFSPAQAGDWDGFNSPWQAC